MNKFLGALIALSAFLCFASNVNANVVDLAVTADSDVNNITKDANNGNSVQFQAQDDRIYAFLKFDLTSIPDGATINSGILNLFLTGGTDNGTLYTHHVSDDSWTETGITWNTMPAMDTSSLSDFVVNLDEHTEQWIALDLFQFGTPDSSEDEDLEDNAASFALKSNAPAFVFDSKESSFVPYLRIDYTPSQVVPEPATLSLLGLGLLGLAGLKRAKRITR